MAQGSKALVGLNDVFEVSLPSKEYNGACSIEYGIFGADGATASSGTIIVEATISGQAWYTKTITKTNKTDVTQLAAASLAYFEVVGDERVRVRMTVAGGAQGVQVWAGAKKG